MLIDGPRRCDCHVLPDRVFGAESWANHFVLRSGQRRLAAHQKGRRSGAEGRNSSKLAIANPKVAPYGIAAQSIMVELGVANAVKDKIVMGENIDQTFN
jgi:ABC-type molybdate transport system substrate-binding protein